MKSTPAIQDLTDNEQAQRWDWLSLCRDWWEKGFDHGVTGCYPDSLIVPPCFQSSFEQGFATGALRNVEF